MRANNPEFSMQEEFDNLVTCKCRFHNILFKVIVTCKCRFYNILSDLRMSLSQYIIHEGRFHTMHRSCMHEVFNIRRGKTHHIIFLYPTSKDARVALLFKLED